MGWVKELKQKNHEILEAAFEYFTLILNIDTTNLSATTTSKNLGKGVRGSCNAVFVKGKIKNITVTVKSDLSVFSMVSTLAHEMIHAKQYQDGRLSVKFKLCWFCYIVPYFDWVTVFDNKETDRLSYFNKPYEREAFENESKLVYSFIKHIAESHKDKEKICQILE